MTEQSLDDIMSERGKAVSEETIIPAAVETTTETVETQAGRDEKGRFATKVETPAIVETVIEQPVATQPAGHVPIQALDAERGKRKDLEDRYEREMRELREQITRLAQPAPVPVEPPAPPPSMFEDPDGYLQHQMRPLQQQLVEQREVFSEMMAVKDYGAETVQAAKAAIEQAARTPEGQQTVQRLMTSLHPFDDLVKWHKRQSALSEVGEDPEAYFQRRLAEHTAAQAQQPQPVPITQPAAPAATLPTAFAKVPSAGPRGGPEYGGPRPLSEIMNGR